MMDVYEAMDFTRKEIDKILEGTNYYTDDWRWNENEILFEFSLFKYSKQPGPFNDKLLGTYRFWNDEDDVFERTVEQQITDWLEDELCWVETEARRKQYAW